MEQVKPIQVAHQGGFQPAVVTGLASVLNQGDTFTTGVNHMDFPSQLLAIPKGCVGIVHKYLDHETDGTVSVLNRDTITARRLIAKTEQDQKQFSVSANEDMLNDIEQTKNFTWEPAYLLSGKRWFNKVKTSFSDKEEAIKFYNFLKTKNCGVMKNWI